MVAAINTNRLVLREWAEADATSAVNIYGADPVSRWLAPWVPRISNRDTMRSTIATWLAQDDAAAPPVGHWAVVHAADGQLVGGAALTYVPTREGSLTVRWELAPTTWGHGYAAEAVDALVHWAMHEAGILDVFALVQPDNVRAAATVKRVGMEWVRELGDEVQVYRIRHGDLGCPEPLDWATVGDPLSAS